jgi:hypothetical protein
MKGGGLFTSNKMAYFCSGKDRGDYLCGESISSYELSVVSFYSLSILKTSSSKLVYLSGLNFAHADCADAG